MKTIKDINCKNKKTLILPSMNVPLKDGKIENNTRILAAVKTIQEALDQEASMICLIFHLGRPGGQRKPELSNRVIAEELEKVINREVVLLSRVEDMERVINDRGYDPRIIYMLENIRYWKEEEENNEEFGKRIGQLFDVYVNDCFAVSHREHASFAQIPKFVKERCAGLLFEEEYVNLKKAKDEVDHPAVAVIGGAKIETKLPVIKNLEKTYDKILVGGLIANEALDQKIKFSDKVLLPVDFAPEGKEDQRLDIGPKTIEMYKEEIAKAKMIVWNGPMGKFEDEEAANGTREIALAVAKNQPAFQLTGGGESVDAIKRYTSFDQFEYVSMSGGAMLDFLAGKTLPGIKALSN